jgi:hypothetical protein
MKTLCLIVYDYEKKCELFSYSDELHKIYEMYEELTNSFEESEIFLISEEIISTNTRVRDFATTTKGLYRSLIVCDGIATNIKLSNENDIPRIY